MRLSEAIRLGSLLRPQIFGDYITKDGSCAIGAAAEANGVDASSEYAINAFEKQFWHVFLEPCPVCDWSMRKGGSVNVVVHLNDDHLWTRERIADWVATIEPADVDQPVAELAAVTVAS